MCAVIGFVGKGGRSASEKLQALFEQSRIRGLHAFGVATPATCRRFLDFESASKFLRGVASKPKPLRLIAHCRYSTSGDWREQENNQPLSIGGATLAFNGVIHMGTAAQWGKLYGFKAATDNDGEIFLRKVLNGEDWARWVREGPFSFAGLMLHRGNVIALRNNRRPLWYLKERRNCFIASTRDIFRRAGCGDSPIEVEPGKAMYVG